MKSLTFSVRGDKALDLYNADPSPEDTFRFTLDGSTVEGILQSTSYTITEGTPVATLEVHVTDDEDVPPT